MTEAPCAPNPTPEHASSPAPASPPHDLSYTQAPGRWFRSAASCIVFARSEKVGRHRILLDGSLANGHLGSFVLLPQITPIRCGAEQARGPVLAESPDNSAGCAASEPLPGAADVVVVGAGAIGLATAYELSLRGVDVVVVERDALGAGTSSGNAGFVVPSHVLPVTEPGTLATAVRGMLRGGGPVTVKASLRLGYLVWLARFLGNCRAAAVAGGGTGAGRARQLERRVVQAVARRGTNRVLLCAERPSCMCTAMRERSPQGAIGRSWRGNSACLPKS